MGLIHPLTGKHYRYAGLPMGSANSPAVAGRLGASFIRKLVERFPEFKGEPSSNSWEEQFKTGRHDPTLGAGRVLLDDSDGTGVALIWAYVDDFFIHAPTKEKLTRALNHFMNLTVEVGMLCNPVKVIPPSQQVKYCGFEYDTVGSPTLHVPEAKISKSLAIVDYLESRGTTEIPRLILAIAIGVLQSLVDATPGRRGQTFLRHLNNKLHESDDMLEAQETYNPKLKYYLKVALNDGCWEDLRWWKTALRQRVCRPVRPHRSGTLITTWGDGSGTGTGGTAEVFDGASTSPMEMWMGTWEPHVHHYENNFSSNWRELCTLHLTLSRELKRAHPRCRDATMFYFTDNVVTYFTVNNGSSTSPTLHKLIVEIKLMELELGCHLVVIHVPGVLMINQGTDGLSRGVWVSPLQERIPTRDLLARIFSPVKLVEGWKLWLYQKYPTVFTTVPSDPIGWKDQWSASQVFHQNSTWIPPPEMASQAISFVMNSWVEQPWDASALFIVPRVLTRSWQYLSKSIVTVAVLKVGTCPYIQHPVPVVLMYLAPHVRSLPSKKSLRMDTSPLPDFNCISAEAALLRGLS